MFSLFQTGMSSHHALVWSWLYKSVGLNCNVGLLHLLRFRFIRLVFSNGFLCMMKMPFFIGLKLWQTGLKSIIFTRGLQTSVLQCTWKKLLDNKKKQNKTKKHCKWLLAWKVVQQKVSVLHICWRDGVLCVSRCWQENYTAMFAVVILPSYVAWPFMLPRWRALCFAAFCACGDFREELKWSRKAGGGALQPSQLSFPPNLVMFTIHGALKRVYFFCFWKDHHPGHALGVLLHLPTRKQI